MTAARWAGSSALLGVALGCQLDPAPAPAPAAPAPIAAPSAAPAASAPPLTSASTQERPPLEAATFARLFRELSEPDQYFFSDNYVSNETSYLQVAPALAVRAVRGGAYLGVGPEQNFSYIAISRPSIAFIVDIRRQNALEHLLYKAAFDEADGRAAFLCLVLGTTCTTKNDAPLDAVLAAADAAWQRKGDQDFAALHERLRRRIEERYAVPLERRDRDALERIHRAFFDKGLDLAFELHSPESRRKYPSLRELMRATSPDGGARSFLASEDDFRWLQGMQRDHRIIPVVGDFAGDHALPGVASELRRRRLAVSVFYTSNVEQYLIDPPKWQRWVSNVDALPTHASSLFLRCYLDQGRRHPQQLPGHRTASVLQLFDHFRAKQQTRGYTGFWQLANDGVLAD